LFRHYLTVGENFSSVAVLSGELPICFALAAVAEPADAVEYSVVPELAWLEELDLVVAVSLQLLAAEEHVKETSSAAVAVGVAEGLQQSTVVRRSKETQPLVPRPNS